MPSPNSPTIKLFFRASPIAPFFSSFIFSSYKIEVLEGYRPRKRILKIHLSLYLNSPIRVCFGVLNIRYFAGNLKKTILARKGTLGFDWNEHILKAKINCNGLYELLGTYEGSLGMCVYNFEAVLQVVLLSPKNRKKSGNNWIDAPDIVSKRLASNNLLKILYKDCLESVFQKLC